MEKPKHVTRENVLYTQICRDIYGGAIPKEEGEELKKLIALKSLKSKRGVRVNLEGKKLDEVYVVKEKLNSSKFDAAIAKIIKFSW